MLENVLLSRLKLNKAVRYSLSLIDRVGYLHVVVGLTLKNNPLLRSGEALGALISNQMSLDALTDNVEALWFELPVE